MLTAIESGLQQATLVRAARGGDRVAFGALYQEYGRLVHGVLLAYVPYSDAEDLMQDVFLKALERLPELREPAAFRGWLLAIARRAATDHRRNRKPTEEPGPWLPARRNSRPDGEAFAVLATIQGLARVLSGDFDSATSGGHDGTGDRRTHRPNCGFGAGEFVPGHEAPAVRLEGREDI